MHPEFTPRWIARFWSRVDRSGGPNACHIWLAGRSERGYGTVTFRGKRFIAHRVAYFLTFGEWPEPFGLHDCDTPLCCNPAHVIPGTQAENMADKAAKGRAPSGDEHWARRTPERVLRGEDHWSKQTPDHMNRYATGDRHGSKTHPGCYPSGDRHYSHTRPELVARGERARSAKLTESIVRDIRSEYDAGATMQAIADRHNISLSSAYRVIRRVTWNHVK